MKRGILWSVVFVAGCSQQPLPVVEQPAPLEQPIVARGTEPDVPTPPTLAFPSDIAWATLLDDATVKLFQERGLKPQDVLAGLTILPESVERGEATATAKVQRQHRGQLFVRHTPEQGWLVDIDERGATSPQLTGVPKNSIAVADLVAWLNADHNRWLTPLKEAGEPTAYPLAALAGLTLDFDDLERIDLTAGKPSGSPAWTPLTIVARGRTVRATFATTEDAKGWRPTKVLRINEQEPVAFFKLVLPRAEK